MWKNTTLLHQNTKASLFKIKTTWAWHLFFDRLPFELVHIPFYQWWKKLSFYIFVSSKMTALSNKGKSVEWKTGYLIIATVTIDQQNNLRDTRSYGSRGFRVSCDRQYINCSSSTIVVVTIAEIPLIAIITVSLWSLWPLRSFFKQL